MLFNRCLSAGARIEMPDVIEGFYTPEEIAEPGQLVFDDDGEVIQVIDIEPTVVTQEPEKPPVVTQEPEPTATKTSSDRSYPPETTRNKLHLTANRTFKKYDGADTTPQHRGFVNGRIKAALDGDDDGRKLFLGYVFDTDTSSALDKAQLMAISKWLVKGEDTGDNELVPEAVEELKLIVRAQQKDAGQQDMFESEHILPEEAVA